MIDVAYLFYLPFCMAFVSNDNLHKRCADLFLRHDQEFIWGGDLKIDLALLNGAYLSLPDSVKERGIMSFGSDRPVLTELKLEPLWSRIFRVRDRADDEDAAEYPRPIDTEMSEIMGWKDGDPVPESEAEGIEYDSMIIERNILRRRGSWYQVPKDLPDR